MNKISSFSIMRFVDIFEEGRAFYPSVRPRKFMPSLIRHFIVPWEAGSESCLSEKK